MTIKLTKWYPHHIKPVHIGYYQVSNDRGTGNKRELGFQGQPQYWDGKQWCHSTEHEWPLVFQDRDWRGLKGEEK